MTMMRLWKSFRVSSKRPEMVSDSLQENQENSSDGLEIVQAELDRRAYYLRTLYDVSRELFGTVSFEAILRNFMLMTMGNFGVFRCFILTCSNSAREVRHFFSVGFDDDQQSRLKQFSCSFLEGNTSCTTDSAAFEKSRSTPFPPDITLIFPFRVDDVRIGLLGLGPKLTEESFTRHDKELLGTLVNNLVVALKNALSFEQIHGLNRELQTKNEELEDALRQLRAAMRKVEILESVKANLCKFVPATVTRMIEKSPTSESLEARERDLSVMFLDIEGYTRITEKVGGTETNSLVEKYFSVFMDAIYTNNGDVMETAGDGLMILFLAEDGKAHALDAVRAAATIREKTADINRESTDVSHPLAINIGITSGRAYLGASRYSSPTGSRWTYTAHGMLVNTAARICARATGGSIFTNRATAERAAEEFPFISLGKFSLKNISKEMEIFELKPQA
jgi:class 3 adenylate cyclase